MQKGFTPILVIVGILVLAIVAGGAYYLGRQTTPKSSPTPVITSQPPQPSAISNETAKSDLIGANWKTYTNEVAKFSIQYPSSMVYTEKSFSEKLKQLMLSNNKETITINYALVGAKTAWGGGCNREEHKNIKFLNKEVEICLGDDYLGQLYVSHPEKIADFQISAQFSPTDKENIFKILSTFKFTW